MKPPLHFRPYSPSPQDTTYRDLLPHRSREGRTVFVTWRLSDSLPPSAELHESLCRAQRRWLRRKGLHCCPWSQNVEEILSLRHPEFLPEYRVIRFRIQEQFDAKQMGACALRHRRAIDAVRTAMEEESNWSVGIGDFVIC